MTIINAKIPKFIQNIKGKKENYSETFNSESLV